MRTIWQRSPLGEAEVEAVAVCSLRSYCNPVHEWQAGEVLASALPGVFVKDP